ncbi:TRAP transporter small permease [Rhodoferax aquaticus]|uniref:TRAP transporter small permease protein n=1 Tax=Rhodoferax aquaticus TaxID=2527691 RepID=A0A515EN47_9BURK|nr:TRAP transporter small permease [Rhodoferax aquaticus]QDL54089.1 TRAP transporter small permease [Rhodoferax aquaticus]
MRKLPAVLELLAKVCAVLGGALLTVVTLLTCASVLGRNLLDVTVVGDFELTGVASGLAVALFMPWCQSKRGHILVDFFTSRASAQTNAKLDRLGALAVCALMAMLAWRTSLGGLNAWDNHSGSMLLGFPDWVVYFGMVPPLLLTALIALRQSIAPNTYAQASP